MASCVQCGRELPPTQTGEQGGPCPYCGQQQPPPEARRAATLEIARMFPVTSALVGINLVVYAACAIASAKSGKGSFFDFDPRMLLKWGADFGPLTLDNQFWRLFTSMFLHGGLIHVAANMWCLWNFGPIVERVYGRYRYLVIYLLTGLASGVSSLAIHPATVSVGASGAIFGIVGALVFPFYRKHLVLPHPVMKSMMRSLVTFIFINLAIGSVVPVIDNAAHIGGLVSGLALGAILTQLAKTGSSLGSVFPKVAAVAALVIAMAFAGVQHFYRDALLAQQAYLALQQGNQQLATEQAQQAVAQYPKSAVAHLALGDVNYAKAQYQDAVKEFGTGHDLDPNDSYIAGRLGLAYVATGRMKDAEPMLRQGLKDNSQDPALLQNLGIALAAQQRPDEGLMYLRQAVQMNPKSAKAQYALGSVLLDQQKYPEAIAPLREAVRLQPDNAEFKKTLAGAEAAVDQPANH